MTRSLVRGCSPGHEPTHPSHLNKKLYVGLHNYRDNIVVLFIEGEKIVFFCNFQELQINLFFLVHSGPTTKALNLPQCGTGPTQK